MSIEDRDGGVVAFYDGFAPDYDLAHAGRWEEAVERQADALDRLLRERLTSEDPSVIRVLDAACGVGTQAIGLARLGYRTVGTDVSSAAIDRLRAVAAREAVHLDAEVADMRDLGDVPGTFDAVIACDNAVPHLLEDDDLARALHQMRSKLRPGGVLIVTMRDFERALRDRPSVAPATVVEGPPRRILVRLQEWDGPESYRYTVRFLTLVEHDDGWQTREHAVRYRAILRDTLDAAATGAGFDPPRWITEGPAAAAFGQHVIVATAGDGATR